MSRYDQLSPILLSAPIQAVPGTDAALTQGQSGFANQQLIQNPNRTAMLIDQFRFIFGINDHGNVPGFALNDWCVQTDIKLGGIPLTKGLVPIVSLCPAYGWNNTSGSYTPGMYIWHLPKPLYVPPGVVLNAKFQAVYGDATFPLRFAVAGRSMPEGFPKPATIYAPWACATQVPPGTSYSDNTFTSSDGDLMNTHGEVLRVKRFIGYKTAQVASRASSFYGYNDNTYDFTLKMTLSSGKMLVRDPVPFTHLFPKSRRYFDVDAVLQPREFVRAIMKYTPPGVDDEYAYMGPAFVSMIGYRELPAPRGVMP